MDIRPARPDDLATLPELERQSDQLFVTLGIGPLPGPGSVSELADALVVLVVGVQPAGFARLEHLADRAHLEQLAVHPDHMRRGLGRALVRASCQWAAGHGYDDITLATYRDVPWNGPFYASEGFSEICSVDDWYTSHGLEPEDPVLAWFGARVLMHRAL